VSASKFIAELREVTAPNIDRHINSRGGDVDEAVAIYNALRDHPSKIVATVDGLAASAASFVAIAADKVVMNRNAEIMLHLPWGGCIGNADDMPRWLIISTGSGRTSLHLRDALRRNG
jgi:ATP-dependent protease ClpP protease subunit